ncbi:MAG TPA: hypothetical protein VNA25_28330 [Phycisphaerae bacterium]|nr:hypothetical protein [Phycisphaerae bacterium]
MSTDRQTRDQHRMGILEAIAAYQRRHSPMKSRRADRKAKRGDPAKAGDVMPNVLARMAGMK